MSAIAKYFSPGNDGGLFEAARVHISAHALEHDLKKNADEIH